MGNPLINELIIGTGSKDRFSMDDPTNDGQFARFFARPAAGRHLQVDRRAGAAAAPRIDLLPLVPYTGPTIPAGTPPGPVADLLRINTGIPPTPAAQQQRLGLLTLLDGNTPTTTPPASPTAAGPTTT